MAISSFKKFEFSEYHLIASGKYLFCRLALAYKTHEYRTSNWIWSPKLPFSTTPSQYCNANNPPTTIPVIISLATCGNLTPVFALPGLGTLDATLLVTGVILLKATLEKDVEPVEVFCAELGPPRSGVLTLNIVLVRDNGVDIRVAVSVWL